MAYLREFLYILGAVASLAGAYVAIRQARRARRAADEAEEVRRQVVTRRQVGELSKIHTMLERATKTMSKYGSTSGSIGLRGTSPDRDAQDVQEFALTLKEHIGLFENGNATEAEETYRSLRTLLEQFSSATTDDRRRAVGTAILHKLADFSPHLKLSRDARER